MEIELAKCVCCGLKEDCTQDYISEVKDKFDGKWFCGLCSEAVIDELNRAAAAGGGGGGGGKKQQVFGIEEAVKAHMAFCRKYKSNPAIKVSDGMRQMLRRRSSDVTASNSSSVSKNYHYSRSASTSKVRDDSEN